MPFNATLVDIFDAVLQYVHVCSACSAGAAGCRHETSSAWSRSDDGLVSTVLVLEPSHSETKRIVDGSGIRTRCGRRREDEMQ